MKRRTFLQTAAAALAANGAALAAAPMPMKKLGKSGLNVSRFCLGGYHMGRRDAETGIAIIHRALDLGVNFFDSAHHYNKGLSDEIYGRAIAPGMRKQVLLMSKAQLRDRDSAMNQLEDTLRRMKTDYLDLWQCHEVSRHDEVDKIFGPSGALEAFVKAKKDGKVRHIGFTGHHDPTVHKRLLDGFDGWETVQCPVNLVDPHYLSFIENVVPRVRKKGLGMIAMKSNAMGGIGENRVAPIEECLRFSWSHDIDTLVSGVETVEQLEQNVAVLKTLQPLSRTEISGILDRTRKGPSGSKVERYKKPEQGATHPIHRDGEPV
jgi:aryl-alcohol dehydrogenase-like predicted oxidoreductase